LKRPAGVTALSFFFAFGALASALAAISLMFPGGILEPVWRINPRGREGLSAMGPPAIVLMAIVCAACAWSALGLWRGMRSAYWLAMTMLAINAVSDVANGDPRTLIGLPVAGALIFCMTTKRFRSFFFGALPCP